MDFFIGTGTKVRNTLEEELSLPKPSDPVLQIILETLAGFKYFEESDKTIKISQPMRILDQTTRNGDFSFGEDEVDSVSEPWEETRIAAPLKTPPNNISLNRYVQQ